MSCIGIQASQLKLLSSSIQTAWWKHCTRVTWDAQYTDPHVTCGLGKGTTFSAPGRTAWGDWLSPCTVSSHTKDGQLHDYQEPATLQHTRASHIFVFSISTLLLMYSPFLYIEQMQLEEGKAQKKNGWWKTEEKGERDIVSPLSATWIRAPTSENTVKLNNKNYLRTTKHED